MITLKNKNILVTRAAPDAKRFAEKIIRYGGKPLVKPLLQINCLPVDKKAAMGTYDWVFFTSQNGVDCFIKQNPYIGELNSRKIAAVGPKTADKIRHYGYQVDFMPSTYNAEVMANEFLTKYPESGPVLLVRGVLSRTVLPDTFEQHNQTYHCLEVYETVVNAHAKDNLQAYLAQEDLDYLTFTSPSTIDAFLQLVDHIDSYRDIPAVCIGTTTERKAREKGFIHTIVPVQFTTDSMLERISEHIQRGK